MDDTTIIRLPDGRDLAACEWGPTGGSALLVLHGTPGSRYVRHPSGEYDRLGIRAVTYDRPGYGCSTRIQGRLNAATAEDVAAIADALNLERFGVFGVSGGGPHALAVAALLPDRVTRCASVVGIGPADAEGLDFFAGMTGQETQANRRAMADAEAYITAVEYPNVQQLVKDLPGSVDLPEPVRLMLRDGLAEGLAAGPGGMIDDYVMSFTAWGFDVADIRCPVTIMAAEQDVVSQRHGSWLAGRIPDARYVVVPGGHFGPREAEEEELLEWLVRS